MPLLTHARGESRSCDIMIDRFTLTVGGKNLLDSASLKITYGRKYGLVGRNGIGKTCLLVAMALREIEKIPSHIRILYVEQEVIGEDKSALESLLETDQERTELLKRAHEVADDSEKLEAVYRRLDEIGANAAPGKAAAILSGLGFTNDTMSVPTKTLSGGWLMRVALARALFADPEILLLDEPTNHLDMEATIWLENYLKSYNHTLIIVSHARDFINNVITDVIHYVAEKLNYYRGNYETFERTRADVYTMQKRQFESQQSQVAHMKKFIDRFRCNAKRASLVQSRIKALNRMDIIDEVVEDPTCVFIFPPVEKISPPLLRIEEGSFSYGERKIFSQVTMNIDMSTRIVLLGQNGSGKSTLLKVLTGELLLTEGNFFSNRRMRIGLFTQQHVDQLDLSLSPLEQMAKLFPAEISETLRGHLGSFGITGNMALRPMYLLSGGQKSRVALSLIAFRQPHVLLLDEPTNHLDLDAVNALIVALNAYSGGVVVVSHDQHFVTSICDELFVIKKGKLKQFKGTFEDYKQSLL
jgi:ATP-binding cassette subfamily F protein 3